MSKRYFITGIGTDVGKTVVSSIVAEALKATYWKPIQAGDIANSDSVKVKSYTSHVNVLPEAFQLSEPMSPHAAAAIDGVEIEMDDLKFPAVQGNLVIEGAGGLMVPFNSKAETYFDLVKKWQLPTIVVSRHYLGSINHTLMTVELLQSAGVDIAGIIFVGDEHKTTEEIILNKTGVKMIARIPIASTLNKEFIQDQASRLSL